MQLMSQVESEHSSFAPGSAISPDIPPGLELLCANVSSVVLGSQLLSSKQGGPQARGGSTCCSPTPQTPEARAQVNRTALSPHLTGTLCQSVN